MKKVLFLVSAISLASLGLLTSDYKRVNAQEHPGCFLIDNSGQYVNLGYICGGEKVNNYSFKEKFFLAIKKLNIPIHHKNCEPNLMGSYSPIKNQMTLCQNNISSEKQYIATLAHESWHIVQDCVGDLDNGITAPVTASDVPGFQSLLNSLNNSDLTNLSLYDPEELPYEVEAFAMEKHPDIVLKGLNACASQQLARK